MSWPAALGAQAVLTGLAALFVYLLLRRQRRGFGTVEERATLRTLAFATSALRSLRRGLSPESASGVLPEVAEQAGAAAVALYDRERLLGFHIAAVGPAESHRLHAGVETAAVLEALAVGRLKLVQLHPRGSEGCEPRSASPPTWPSCWPPSSACSTPRGSASRWPGASCARFGPRSRPTSSTTR